MTRALLAAVAAAGYLGFTPSGRKTLESVAPGAAALLTGTVGVRQWQRAARYRHLRVTVARIVSRIASSDAPPRRSAFTSVSSRANRQ
mgnify:CR=1 FL=1